MPDKKRKKFSRGAFWSGTLTFGLVSIPVALFPGNRTRRISLRMLAPDGSPLRRRYYCPRDDRLVDKDEIVRGYEYEKEKFVLVADEELNALEPKKSREIDLRRFVSAEQIDPVYFDRSYFFVPAGDSQKPYRLLAQAMEKTGRAGIATFVMRGKEYLVAILAENGFIRAETLRFADEIRTPEDVGLPEPASVSESDVNEMEREIEAATAENIDPDEMKDRETEKLAALIGRKKAKGKDVVYAPRPEAEKEEERGGEVVDIMEVLKRSVEQAENAER